MWMCLSKWVHLTELHRSYFWSQEKKKKRQKKPPYRVRHCNLKIELVKGYGGGHDYSTWNTIGIVGNISDFKWERKCSKYSENKVLCISAREETTSWAPKPLRPKSHHAPWGKTKHGIICLLSMGISFQNKCHVRMSLLWQFFCFSSDG